MSFRQLSETLTAALKTWDGGAVSNANIRRLCLQLFHSARSADARAPPKHLEEAARLLSRVFSMSISDRAHPDGQSIGHAAEKRSAIAIFLAIILLRTHFILRTTRLCGNVVRAVENSVGLAPKSLFVEWHYFNGRLQLDGGDFAKAAEHFSTALRRCLKNTPQFGILLIYAVVSKMIAEYKLPCKSASSQYLPVELQDAIVHCRRGSAFDVEKSIEQHQPFWLRLRLYLVARLWFPQIATRCLLRRTAVALDALKEARMGVTAFTAACRLRVDPAMQAEEAESMLAALIAAGKVKGYISREYSTLVLSKKNPFP